jgi:hypothetical protein
MKFAEFPTKLLELWFSSLNQSNSSKSIFSDCRKRDAGWVMEIILLKTCAVRTVSNEVNFSSRASASVMVSLLWFLDWQSSRVSIKHLNNSPLCAKKIFSKAFLWDHPLVVDTLCGRWICWILDSFCFSSRMSLRYIS